MLKSINFRFDEEDVDHLDKLAEVAGVSRAEFVRAFIRREWDHYNGDPELQALAESLKQIQDQMQEVIGSGYLAALKK